MNGGRSFSLRTRLVAVAVGLVAFGVLATSFATYALLRHFIYGRLDDQLASVADHPVPVCFGSGPGPGQSGVEVTPYDSDGNELVPTALCPAGESRIAVAQLTAEDATVLLNRPGVIRTVVTRDGVPARAVAVSGQLPIARFGPTVDGYEIFTISTADARATITKMVGVELIVGIAVIAAAGALSGLGVRLGLRPLDRVTRTAREVAEELSPDGSGLDKRVPVADPHTEVGQLAVAVNTMLDTVETEYGARYESEQRMRRFLADASHELRTPLTSLRGYAELIRLRDKESGDPDSRDALRRIEAEGTRMSRLVDDLLTLARHDRGAVPEWEPVDLVAVVADAVAGVHAAHPERPITLTDPGEPSIVLGDRDQLLQVVRNVLTNAATHTPDGPITAAVRVAGPEVVVTVRDTGPGLPPEQAAQVFDRFWRAESGRTRARGGSGLGMSIVAALLAAHGGRVTFDSAPEAGTTVTIRLPLAASHQPAWQPAPSQERVNAP
jgi:two-component system, OmpR family, sensor kinase